MVHFFPEECGKMSYLWYDMYPDMQMLMSRYSAHAESLEQCGNPLIDKLASGILTTAKKGSVQVLKNE